MGLFPVLLNSTGGLVMSGTFSPSLDNLLPLIFPFLLRLSPATLIPQWKNRGGGKWLLNCILKFYESKMPRDNIGCQSGLPLKESFVSPSSWFYVVTFPFTTLFSILKVYHSVMSVSGVFAGSELNMHVTSQDEATLCQVIVADSAHPPTPYSPFPTQHLSDGDREFFVGWDHYVCEVFSYFIKVQHWGKWAKFPKLLQQKTQEESLCFCCGSIRRGITSQLHSLISLFSLVSLAMSHCEDYSTNRNNVPFTDQQMDTRDGIGIQ